MHWQSNGHLEEFVKINRLRSSVFSVRQFREGGFMKHEDQIKRSNNPNCCVQCYKYTCLFNFTTVHMPNGLLTILLEV